MTGNEIRENEIDERLDIEKMKLENNEDQAAERIRIADEKLILLDLRKEKVMKRKLRVLKAKGTSRCC